MDGGAQAVTDLRVPAATSLDKTRAGSPWAIAGCTAAVFAVDFLTPRSVAACLLYAVPILLTRLSPRWLSPHVIGAVATALTVLAMVPSSGSPYTGGMVTRALTIGMLWAAVVLHARRLRAETTLHVAAARLRQAQRLVRLGYWERDLDAGRITLSAEACQMFGLDPGELSPDLSRWHEQWQKLIHPEDRERAATAYATALAGGPDYDVEYRVLQPEMGLRFIHSCGEIIREASGRPVRVFGTMQDITELRHAEALLRTSETLLRAFVDHATDAFFMHGADGIIIDVNRRASESLGYTREELIGKGPAFFDAGILAKPEAMAKTVAMLRAGEEVAFESLHRRKDGSLFPVEVKAASFSAEDRRFTVALARDLTERKKAEASLRLFRSLIDHSTDAIEVVDPATGCFLDVNEQACRLHGYTRDEYLALTVQDLASLGGAQSWHGVADEIRQAGSQVTEGQRRRKDGSIFPVEVNISYCRLDREYMLAIVRDIAARKNAEDALRRSREHLDALIRTVDGIVWEAEPGAHQFTFVSPRAERLLGYPVQQWLEDPSFWSTHIHRDDRDHAVCCWSACVREQRDHEIEYRMLAADGRSVWLRDLVSVVIADGRVVALRGIMVDVTERRRLEEQLRQSQKMEALGQLAGGVAHDLNNILTTIIMEAELAIGSAESGNDGGAAAPDAYGDRDGQGDAGGARPTANELMRGMLQIRGAAERAADLTRRLLLVSRKQVMKPRLMDLNEVVSHIAQMLERLIGEDVTLTLKVDTSPRLLRADAGMLDQVILNLAVNARDAMPNGGRLEIETGETIIDEAAARANPDAAPGRYVWLSVTDTGCGIPPDVLPRIFEPFFTTKDHGKGTGLGLATVYGIVKQHRGWIRVDTQVGRGSTFRIALPASEGSSAAPEAQPRARARGDGETILLVEDEDSVRRIARTVLERHGYHVIEAASGTEALEICQQTRRGTIALLLTDLVMPGGMTGQQLAAHLRAGEPGLKIVYTSGYSAEIAGRELSLGPGSNFLQKPFSPETLLDTVRRTLDGTPV